jgi:hypothetical protein
MFHGQTGPAHRVVDGWYLTGGLAAPDCDGYFWFTAKR